MILYNFISQFLKIPTKVKYSNLFIYVKLKLRLILSLRTSGPNFVCNKTHNDESLNSKSKCINCFINYSNLIPDSVPQNLSLQLDNSMYFSLIYAISTTGPYTQMPNPFDHTYLFTSYKQLHMGFWASINVTMMKIGQSLKGHSGSCSN